MNKRFYNLARVRIDIDSMIANATEENRTDLLNHILWHLPEGTAFDNSDRDAFVADITAALSGTPIEPTPDQEQTPVPEPTPVEPTPDPEQTPDENTDEIVNGDDEDLSEIDVEE